MLSGLRKFFIPFLCVLILLSMTACSDKTEEAANPTEPSTEVASSVLVEPDDEPKDDPIATVITPQGKVVETPGAVSESAAVTADYFNNVAFVGDSVSLMLSYYAASTGELGSAQFFTAGSLGSANALWDVSDQSVHPSYQGVKMLVEDCVANSGASKVYIMLGMNDLALYGLEDTIKNYTELISRIKAKSPSVEIVIQSMTPMHSSSTIMNEDLNNDIIKIYNNRLSKLCKDNGWAFVDVASVMYDAEGASLHSDYCSDPNGLGVHFSNEGCAQWVSYLKTHTP